MGNIAVSPCSNPQMELDGVLKAYSALGYRKFEAFTGWAKSAFDLKADPGLYREKAARYGMSFSSMHLPPVTDDLETTLAGAAQAARFAEAAGAGVVLFKANTRENYVRAGVRFLDAVEGLKITPVVQNHRGTAISTLADCREVLEGIGDARMKALLEVGHFHSVGVSWPQACELLAGRIALIHVKDQVAAQSVPFGTGEIDLPGLFSHMHSLGYAGDYVVEMEVQDGQNTLGYLGDALQYLRDRCEGARP